tara:strand:- start:6733 stop:7944 length:1212 start_codon:yes stop_codon:yes gene_type:complete
MKNKNFPKQKRTALKNIKYFLISIITFGLLHACKYENSGNIKNLKQRRIAKSDIRIPEEKLPKPIFEYVLVNYSTAIVITSKIENNGNFELELDNKLQLVFDSDGSFLGIDDDTTSSFGDLSIKLNSLPSKIQKRIHGYYPERNITTAELENNGQYEIVLSDGSTIIFDKNEKFLGVGKELRYGGEAILESINDMEEPLVTSKINPAMLPSVALDYLVSHYDSYAVMEVSLEEYGDYEVTLDNGTEIYFNSSGSFLDTGNAYGSDTGDNEGGTIISTNELPQLIVDQISISYPQLSITQARKRANDRIDIDLSNGLEIYFDANGSYLSTDENNNGDDHGTVVDLKTTPPEVQKYLLTNYLNTPVSKVQLEASGHYKIFFVNEKQIYLDVNGKLIKDVNTPENE